MRQGLALLACGLIALSDASASSDIAPERERTLTHALYALGVKYRYGGASLEEGFDCSGLVTHVYERAWGIALPRVVDEQRHVGIYVGRGFFVHAPRPGAKVRMESVQTPYWRERFNGARRLDPPTF